VCVFVCVCVCVCVCVLPLAVTGTQLSSSLSQARDSGNAAMVSDLLVVSGTAVYCG